MHSITSQSRIVRYDVIFLIIFALENTFSRIGLAFFIYVHIYMCLQKTVFLEILRVSECNDRSFLHVSKSHRHNLAVIGSSILFESRVFFFFKNFKLIFPFNWRSHTLADPFLPEPCPPPARARFDDQNSRFSHTHTYIHTHKMPEEILKRYLTNRIAYEWQYIEKLIPTDNVCMCR